jgi:hypothetical protein
MLDVADRDSFLRWLAANQDDIVGPAEFRLWLAEHEEDLFDQLSQRPRSVKLWASDYARALRAAVAELPDGGMKLWVTEFAKALRATTEEMGEDVGFAGVFSDTGDEMGLHDPEADDEEEW